MHADNGRLAEGETQVSVIGGGKFPLHDERRIAGRRRISESGWVGHVERVDAAAAGAQSADDPGRQPLAACTSAAVGEPST